MNRRSSGSSDCQCTSSAASHPSLSLPKTPSARQRQRISSALAIKTIDLGDGPGEQHLGSQDLRPRARPMLAVASAPVGPRDLGPRPQVLVDFVGRWFFCHHYTQRNDVS